MDISDEALETLQHRLRFKVRYHLSYWSADDIVQETIARVLRAARENSIRNPESWAAFASATCKNVIREYRRDHWRENGGSGRLPELPDPATKAPAKALEAHDLVARTLEHMLPRDRQLLRAFYLKEQSPDQICKEMGFTSGSFRVALFRAKERFRNLISHPVKRSHVEPHYLSKR